MTPRFILALLAASIVPLGSASAQDQAPHQQPQEQLAAKANGPAGERPAGPPPAAANGGPGRPDTQGLSVTLGFAPVLSPAFQGSRDMTLSVFPDLRLKYDDAIFASIPEGLGWNAINADGWKAGPLAKIRFGRDEDTGGSPFLIAGDSDALIGLGDIGTSGEIGGFVEKRFGPRRAWQLRGEVLQGFGGHDGILADVSLNYRTRVSGANVSFGPRASFASSDFTQTYFGIDSVQSANSGLPVFEADGGLLSWGVGGTAIKPIDRRSAVTLFTSLERLGGSAEDSPLVTQRGRATQFTIGIGYGVRFGL
ncbi:MAG: MipA/OmpV family protein [Erythrobacter sp.]